MRRGTTPTFSFEVDMDLTGWDTYITFEQGKGQKRVEITHKEPEITPGNDGGCIASVELTQAETLSFKPGPASAQLRAVKNGTAVASTIFEFDVGEILLDGEIPQEV